MDEGKPDFLAGMSPGDFVKILIALAFSLAGFYLIWRMMFGPPLFEGAVQAIQSVQQHQTQSTAPSEVTVGIGGGNPNNANPPQKH